VFKVKKGPVLEAFHYHIDNLALGPTPFVFATRAPVRPNPISISVVRLVGCQDNELKILNADVLDGAPLLEIKPYVPDFDVFDVDGIGWLEQSGKAVVQHRSDDRFSRG
jgi:tRNA (Thr-GGU) A37 N-methylase